MTPLRLLPLCCAILLAACATPEPGADAPGGAATAAAGPTSAARLAVISPACFEQLLGFVAAQTGRKVTLGPPSTFANSDRLVLEPPGYRTADGRVVPRSGGEQPETFRFVQGSGACQVLHERTGAQGALPACGCVLAPPS